MACCMDLGFWNSGASTGMMDLIGERSAAASSGSYCCSSPSSRHSAIRRCKNQSPVMFCRNVILPPMPPSLVNCALRASSVSMGASISTPSNDHVPELMKATGCSSALAGTAATALAVSCEPTAMTSTSPNPVSSAMSLRRRPRTVPGITIGQKRWRGRPRRSINGQSHVRVLALSISEVEAMVYSVLASPVRKNEKRSGVKSMRSAICNCGESAFFMLSNWNRVFISIT